MSKVIGIIGGNGVAATNKLQELIEIELTKNGAFRDCHHPEMIIWQATQAPSRSMYLEGRGESFIDDYVKIAKHLKNCGVNKICMCCNTAHYAIDEISQKSGVEFINIIEGVAKKVKKLGIKKVGLCASDGCYITKIYNKYFDQICPDVEIIYPDEVHQKLVTKGICNTKNQYRFENEQSSERPKNIFTKLKTYMKTLGAEKVIMGCTDIRVDYYDKENIDSLEVLKEMIIEEIGENNE